MKKTVFGAASVIMLAASLFLVSCEKDETPNLTPETYNGTGRVDFSRSVSSGNVTDASFQFVYNTPNAFGDAQSTITGTMKFSGFPSTPDSVAFFAEKADKSLVSYLLIGANSTASNFYTFVNSATAGSFTITNYPVTSEAAEPLREGRGFLRIGKSGRYIYYLIDRVVKQ